MGEPQTEPDQEAERAVEYFLDGGWFAKYWRAASHGLIVTSAGQAVRDDADG